MNRQKVILAMIIAGIVCISAQAKYGGGSGTANDPYLIYTPEQMNDIGLSGNSDDWDKCFRLMADINLSGYTGPDFNIIGSGWDEPFTGVFDGNGYKIYNFSYGPFAYDNYVGIFGMVGDVDGNGGEIKNLGLINPSIDVGAFMTGGLVGRVVLGSITNCYVEGGSVTGDDSVGGLVGDIGFINAEVSNCYTNTSVSGDWCVGGLMAWNNGAINNCYATGSVVGNSEIGGLVGSNEEIAIISNCYATGSVEGSDDTGGLAGRNWGGKISNCYATGDVWGDNGTGGLVGQNSGANGYAATISNSYAAGDVTGIYNAGGLTGINVGFMNPADIINCYSVGGVSGESNVGGLVGRNLAGSVVDSFWDIETGGPDNGIGTPLPTEQLQTMSTFTDAGWDFVGETTNGTDDIWRLCEDLVSYPRLSWQFLLGDLLCPDGVNFVDYSFFADHWDDEPCYEFNNYCDATDLDKLGTVDLSDLLIFSGNWLEGF